MRNGNTVFDWLRVNAAVYEKAMTGCAPKGRSTCRALKVTVIRSVSIAGAGGRIGKNGIHRFRPTPSAPTRHPKPPKRDSTDSNMHSIIAALISALAVTAILANSVAIGNPSSTVEKRATNTLVCAGHGSGKSIGVEACCDVTFKDRNNIEFDCCVTDTKADGHGVYAWLRTSGDNGYYKDLPTSGVLKNNNGKGKSVTRTMLRSVVC